MQTAALPGNLVRIALSFLEELDTPISLGVALRLRHGDWDGIARLSCSPGNYNSAVSYFKDVSAISLLKKLSELPNNKPAIHPKTGDFQPEGTRLFNAKQTWWAGERDCWKANERLCRYLPEFRNSEDISVPISEVFSEVRKLIRSWVGPSAPSLTAGRFGPGATYSDRGRRTTPPHKMSSIPSLTRGAIWWLPQWLETKWGRHVTQAHGQLSFVPGNRFTTVPKTAITDRCIAVEPAINVFYQLALGRSLRRRLAANAYWDLDTAQDIHRRVAEDSSRSSEFATLDLSNASDTLCRNLVKVLMPSGWWDCLNDLRSSRTLIDGKWVVLEKFSSMGNGFTFELETIIFSALACVASRRCGHQGLLGVDVFVFGDDIIVPNDVAVPLTQLLRFCGFSLNEQKSFHGPSPFRESCGADFFDGLPVRPYYLKEIPNGPQGYVAFANGLRALSDRLTISGGGRIVRAWFHVLDELPVAVRRCRGPQALGDLVIHDDERTWNVRWRSSIRYLRALRPHRYRIVRFDGFDPEVVLACATYGTGNFREGVIPRDGLLSHKVGWYPYS